MEFSDSSIGSIYTTHVKLPGSYFTKYDPLPPCPIKAMNYTWSFHDFPRNWTTLDFIEWTKKYNLQTVDSLAYTSTDDFELEFIHANKKTYLPYPGNDLHTIAAKFQNEFDFFLFNQTIEHLYNPFEAMKQIYQVVKPGGYVFTSVPTINIPHSTPFHFNGYNPMGLAMLFKTANFEIMEIGQWGNYEYISKLFQKHQWPGYSSLSSTSNEERNVCQCWILAKKT
jgi:SAM-dependent methyltransferase